MLRRVINPFLLLPLTLSMNTFNVLSSEIKNYIDNVLEEKSNVTFIDYQEIEKLVLNNQELKSLQNPIRFCSLFVSKSPLTLRISLREILLILCSIFFSLSDC